MKEATVIYKQRHHAIVEIMALFQGTDSNTFYMQMPWYTHGSLDTWVLGDQRPYWPQVRSVLLNALLGLAHLHHNGVIHSDVKPANILVDDRQRGRLSDFDISIDTREHTSTARIIRKTSTTMRATALGMTTDFAAPELQTSGQATKQTDMFAYGKTVQDVQGRCEPDAHAAGGEVRGHTAELVTALISVDPKTRPSANHTMRFIFSTILREVGKKVARMCLVCESSGDDAVKDSDAGIECSEGRFHCGPCVSKLVQGVLQIEYSGTRALQDSQIMCSKYPSECRTVGFHDRDLALHRLLSFSKPI